jgi:hypothetical protein
MSWGKADLSTITEIVRAAESYLAAQLDLATSADQRAATMASAFTLAGAATVAGLITLASTSDGGLALRLPIYVGGSIAAVMFLIGACCCVTATIPVKFWLSGNEPDNWRDDVLEGEELKKMLADQANNYQAHIGENAGVLSANARRFKWGALIGVAAPFVGFAAWLFGGVSYLLR